MCVFKSNSTYIVTLFGLLLLVSCGGGGGGGGGEGPTTPTTPAPTVNLSADPVSVLLDNSSTLTWSSSYANTCSADWTTQTGTSGSEAVTISTTGTNSFSITCSGDGGSKSASVMVEGYRETDGVVVDGYISGAEVCIDEDESWTCDSNENSTTSDNEGKFTIRYANGNLVSIGGTDLDSQTLLDNLLITHKLTGHSDFKAVTPVTSIAAFMEDASLVNTALGIDSSIDVFTFDPVANKGDGGINDYLYEKGNQLTVLAFALQNITNNLNTTTETTQDYFKAITEEIEKEYTETETKVDIETETFVTKALENVITAKSVTIDEAAKANTAKALAGVMPIIEVKSSDDLTTGVIRFAVSTLQTDIQAIANGTATAETVTSYTSDVLAYIAEDQNIDADEITPDISAISDSASTIEDTAVTINVVANDSYLTSAPISVTTGNGTNGTTTIAESSPEQITYEPDADYNGTDTFSYTITQGDKTSSADVTVTIEAVNDAPTIDIASTIQVQENQTAVTSVSVSDVDEDELTLTLGGTDADSFNLSDESVLTFKEAPDYETKDSYSITLTLTDGTETVVKDITITIIDINDVAPVFTSDTTFSAAENQTAIGTVTATDAEGDEVTFTISGDELAITSAGVLTFVSAPDYETKSSYTATITASDGTNSTTQDITVSINNLNDNSPSFTSSPTFNVAENQSSIGNVTATDADGDTLVFSISGSEIQTTSNGTLSFISVPDYETKNSYSATVTVTDGVYQETQDIVVNITDVDDTFSFKGKTIDGYIAGANIFIDQNYNFKLDSGELSSTTDNAGSFVISTGDESLFNCLKDRPIVANVPVGAIDSTLGEVTKAYQMILPSINETGSSSIIISPFSSLLGNAILEGKQSAELKEDLTVSEGCSTEGNNVASQVSTALGTLYSDISTNFGIDKNTLLSDFILNPSSNISENIAQNIASLFPYTKEIDNQISDFLTEKFDKEIRANVVLSEDALDIIFGNTNYDKLPLSFSSRYETEKNSSGWFQTEELSASNGFISDTGVLSREHCSETDTVGCNLTDITLENIANTSTQYRKTSNFLNTSISISELKAGSLAVTSNDSRSWRDGSVGWDVDNSRARECQSSDDIQFQVTGNNKLLNFHYSSYSQGYMQFDCSTYRKYYYPKLNVSTIMDQSVNDNSIQVNYYIPDVIRSGVVSNPPFDFVENRLTIDPTDVIKEMATLPTFYSQLNSIRRKFIGEEYLLFEYHHDPYITYFEMGTFPRNDMYWDQETLGDNRLYGQEARDAFFNKLKSEVTFDSEVFGASAPINSSILGRIAESYVEIVDYDDNNDAIVLPIYPSYNSSTKTLNMSLVNSELNLSNLKDFIKNGINGKPVTANIYYNPDDSINGTIPVALYLYKGNDTSLDSGEAYFSIEFDLKVLSSQGSAENPYHRTGIQTFVIEKDAVIVAKYVENEITIERNIINLDSDQITLEDAVSGSSPISQPASLEVKVLNLINKVSDSIGGIQSFFDEGGEYTYKLDLGTGGFSLVDFSRNTIDFIEGTFRVSENPTYAINVNDIIVHEGQTENLCFTRPSSGDLSPTSFNLSFTERERPGRGALADDFELSSSLVNFNQGDTQSCIVVTGVLDKHFDWGHDAYLDISSPSNGQALSRNQVKIRIVDYWGAWNRISFKNR